MEPSIIIGTLTIIVGVLVKIIGLPDQIRQNHRRRSTEGLSSTFVVVALLSYVLWTAHGLLQRDWVVVIGQGVGVITMGIIAYQVFKYRGRKPR